MYFSPAPALRPFGPLVEHLLTEIEPIVSCSVRTDRLADRRAETRAVRCAGTFAFGSALLSTDCIRKWRPLRRQGLVGAACGSAGRRRTQPRCRIGLSLAANEWSRECHDLARDSNVNIRRSGDRRAKPPLPAVRGSAARPEKKRRETLDIRKRQKKERIRPDIEKKRGG